MELREELVRLLPDGHPFVNKFDKYLKGEGEVIPNWFGAFEGLVESIDDWKRGIRDWEEVEPHLADSREALSSSKEY